MAWVDPKTIWASSPYRVQDDIAGSIPFLQLFQSIPALEPYYTNWEKNFKVEDYFGLFLYNPWVPIVSVILYLSFLVEGKRYIERRGKPVDLGRIPALWNLFLAIFSICGAVRVVPHFFYMFTFYDFKGTVCASPQAAGYGGGAAGLWCMLFTASKVFELFDTVILVLKGKDPMFLHWYHHVTVLLYTWFSYSARNPGLYFIAMNYTVHAIMYTYYFLMEMKMWPKWLNPIFITLMQISQMFVGVGITVASYIYQKDPKCDCVRYLIPWCAAMYATYLYFFVEFFVSRFLLGGGQKGAKKAGANGVQVNGGKSKKEA